MPENLQKDIMDFLTPYRTCFGFRNNSSRPATVQLYSCFIVSINGHWTLWTAAHNIHHAEAIVAQGDKISDWYIDDVSSGSFKRPYPFDVLSRERFLIFDEAQGYDYCVILIEDLAANAMQAAGLKALNFDDSADPYDDEIAAWFLLGVPASTVHSAGLHVRHIYTGLRITPLRTRPENWDDEVSKDALFGQLDDIDEPEATRTDIRGMSGGPIFGIYRSENRIKAVKIIGIQSGWNEKRRIITASRVRDLLLAFNLAIESAK